MNSRSIIQPPFLLLLLLTALMLSACAPNWPQFRGPDQNNLVEGKKLPEHWNDSTHIRWRVQLEGESWTSPIILVDKVFTAAALPVSKALPDTARAGGEEDLSYLKNTWRWEVSCYHLKTGELLWRQVAKEGPQRIKKHRAHNFAAETPVTDGKRLYVYFGMTGVYCYDLRGKLIWEKDLGAYQTLRDWGTGSSPVVYADWLFIQVDNEEASFLVALDKENGEELWRVKRDEKTNYSTPYIWKNHMRTELVVGGKTARSYDPANGDLLWELEVEGYYNIPSAVGDKDYLYLGNTAWRNTPGSLQCIRAGAEGMITPDKATGESKGVAWTYYDAPLNNPSPLLYKGLLYLVSNQGGQISCLNAFNGKLIYQESIKGVARVWSSPWMAGERVHFTDEKGATHVFKAGRQFEYLHSNTLNDQFWTTMAAARDAYIMKGSNMMYCIGD